MLGPILFQDETVQPSESYEVVDRSSESVGSIRVSRIYFVIEIDHAVLIRYMPNEFFLLAIVETTGLRCLFERHRWRKRGFSFVAKWSAGHPSIGRQAASLPEGGALAFMAFHPSLRGKLCANNCIEGFNKEIRRLAKKRVQFVDESAMGKRLVSIADKPFVRNFTVDYLGSVLKGRPINHLNLTMTRMEELIIEQLRDGLPVWLGGDVSFYRGRNGHAWNDASMDFESAIGFNPEFNKGVMLDFGASAMNHAILITGVDLKEGRPAHWKIENFWGTDVGVRGCFVMSKSWFARYVYRAVVAKKYLSKEELDATEAATTHLEPWDPMGTLAG